MLSDKERITNRDEVARMLRIATLERVFLDVSTADRSLSYQSLFLCKGGNLGSRDALYITAPEQNVDRIARPGSKVSIRYQWDSNLFEIVVPFKAQEEKRGQPCLRLGFPRSLSVKKVRQFNRFNIPSDVTLSATVRKRGLKPFPAEVSDLGLGGLSLIYPVPEKRAKRGLNSGRFKGEDLIKLEVHVPDGHTSIDITINGAIRRVSTIRMGENDLREILGVEIMLIDLSLKSRFNELVEELEEESRRQREEEDSEESFDPELLEECDHKKGHMEDQSPEVYDAIRGGQSEEMLAHLASWQGNQDVTMELVEGLVKHGSSSELLAAFRHLYPHEGHPGVELLFNALLEKRHFATLMEMLQILPEASPFMTPLCGCVVDAFRGEKLMEAVRRTRNKPKIQSQLITNLVDRGSVDDFVQSLGFMEENPHGTMLVVDQISKRSDTSDDYMRVIAMMRNMTRGDSNQALEVLLKKFIKVATDGALLQVLERYVSDQGEAGQILTSEMAHRGNPLLVAKAFKQVAMDSTSSMVLAYGLVQCGTREYIEAALEFCGSCPRARTILQGQLLRFQMKRKLGFLSSTFSDAQRKDLLGKSKVYYAEAEDAFKKIRARVEKEV
ncbi:MAG: PilZ domain-containing protein [Magnetococcales bacterium]|nr:PilZ domain-containing protein [Magnetococcales bacterium]